MSQPGRYEDELERLRDGSYQPVWAGVLAVFEAELPGLWRARRAWALTQIGKAEALVDSELRWARRRSGQ